jgi:hypothetical protein
MGVVEPFAGLNPARRSGPGLTDIQIADLELALGRRLPGDYARFLRWANGWRGTHGSAYIALASVEDLVWMNDDEFRSAFPGLIDIGGDGGLESYALDYRNAGAPPGLVAVDRVSASPEDIWPLATGFVAGLAVLAQRY